jgi:demethylmenaquinone methyltransferase / 2-methoxy-6-polyprenyl-1,4-benzoquinol methylase
VPPLDVGDESLDGPGGRGEGIRERRGVIPQRLLEPPCGGADLVEIDGRGHDRRCADRPFEPEGRRLGRLDPGWLLRHAHLGELRSQLLQLPATGQLAGELAEDDDRGRFPHAFALLDGPELGVEHEPTAFVVVAERDQIRPPPSCRLGCEHGRHPAVGRRSRSGLLEIVGERHRISLCSQRVEKTDHAKTLFAPLAPTYDRYATVLSYGQDPRWRRFLVSRIDAGPGDRVLDVATGTGAVARELIRQKGCAVVGVDQSREMLGEARRRLREDAELVEASAEALPFADGEFDALTFTYLLRYVDDPPSVMTELARVVKPGGTIAGLEFGLPEGPWRGLWELHVRAALPAAGAVTRNGWREVGSFLGPSIRAYHEAWPLERQLDAWRGAGIGNVQARRLSLGGGIVTWGQKR